MISIIIPAYNCSQCIEKTLDSILVQTYKDFEIVIVNDGSTDNTDEVIRNYMVAHQGLKITYKVTANGGPGSARNHGLSLASGDYIVFVDSDDIVCPIYLETLYNGIIKNVDFCFGSYIRVVDGNSKNELMKNELYGVHSAEKIFVSFFSNKTYISLWNSIFVAQIINDNGLKFIDGCYIGEDVDFIARYLMCCDKVSSLKNVIYTFYFDSVRAAKRMEKDLPIRIQDSSYWHLFEETKNIGWNEGTNVLEFGKFSVGSFMKIIAYAKICATYDEFSQKVISVKNDYNYEGKLKKKYLKKSIYYKVRLANILLKCSPKLFYFLLNKRSKGN